MSSAEKKAKHRLRPEYRQAQRLFYSVYSVTTEHMCHFMSIKKNHLHHFAEVKVYRHT